MFGKNLWALSVLFVVASLIATGFVGAVNTQAAEMEPSATEKIGGKIAEYKVAHPEWKERLEKPEQSLGWNWRKIVCAIPVIGDFASFGYGFSDGSRRAQGLVDYDYVREQARSTYWDGWAKYYPGSYFGLASYGIGLGFGAFYGACAY